MKKLFGYLKDLIVHKWWVFYYCCKFGIPLRGLTHDLSKLSPSELFENVKYYNGQQSPIVNCKEKNGYSKAWLHHRGHNKHHYEYWCDQLDEGGRALIMPLTDTLEMLADYLAAGRTYDKKEFSYAYEYNWWMTRREKPMAMHIVQKIFISHSLYNFMVQDKLCSKKELKTFYNQILETYNEH